MTPAATDAAAAMDQRWQGRFWLVAALALAMAIGPLTLYALSSMSPMIVADLGLSRSQFGIFATVAFAVASGSSPLLGRWADALGPRVLMLGLFVGSGLSLLAAAWASSLGWMFAAVAVCGGVQALSNPVTNQLISVRVPPAERGWVMGVKQAGVQMGQLAAGLAFPALALVMGWRAATAWGVVLAVAGILATLRAIPSQRGVPAPARTTLGFRSLPATVWWLAGYAFLTGAGLQAANVYLPLYGYEVLGLPVTAAGLAGAFSGAMGMTGRMLWARAIGRFRHPLPPFAILAAVAATGLVLILLSGVWRAPLWMWIGIALFASTASSSTVVVMLAVLRTVPAHRTGSASGVAAVGMYAGFAVGPMCFGVVADLTGSYLPAWTAAAGAFGLALLLVAAWARRGPGPVEPGKIIQMGDR
jgi:predicted MFS family arabinose efflux permease